MLGHLERNILFVVLSCSFVSSLALALFVMTRPAPPAVECYLQFLNQSPSDPIILEAAFVGNDIQWPGDKGSGIFRLFAFSRNIKHPRLEVASHIKRGVNYQ
jgi:hypothetical protein